MSTRTYRSAIQEAMATAMGQSDNTVIIGQGVTDHKGIFDTVTGLSKEFPSRVIEAPLAEDSTAGACVGMALNGIYPINTHIRNDFAVLAMNQIVNLAAKYRYMFGGLFELPMIFRLVVGRGWGQGAQHSQSIQSILAHIPGLVVVMPATPNALLSTYDWAINKHRGPVVVIEHRLLYEIEFENEENELSHPLMGSRLDRSGSDLTIVASSIMVLEARRAASFLQERGISVEIVDIHSASHFDRDIILASVRKTRRVLIADTSWKPYGLSAEISRLILENLPNELIAPLRTLGLANASCPTAKKLENLFYPDLRDMVEECYELMGQRNNSSSVPEAKSMTDFYKHFRGPF